MHAAPAVPATAVFLTRATPARRGLRASGAPWAPSRQTCARTGCVVCNEGSSLRVARRVCAESSPRTTEIKKPASRITVRSARPSLRLLPHQAVRSLGPTPQERSLERLPAILIGREATHRFANRGSRAAECRSEPFEESGGVHRRAAPFSWPCHRLYWACVAPLPGFLELRVGRPRTVWLPTGSYLVSVNQETCARDLSAAECLS